MACDGSLTSREADLILARQCERGIVESDIARLFSGAGDRKELRAAIKTVDRLPETDKCPLTNVTAIVADTVSYGCTRQHEPKDGCGSEAQVISHGEIPLGYGLLSLQSPGVAKPRSFVCNAVKTTEQFTRTLVSNASCSRIDAGECVKQPGNDLRHPLQTTHDRLNHGQVQLIDDLLFWPVGIGRGVYEAGLPLTRYFVQTLCIT